MSGISLGTAMMVSAAVAAAGTAVNVYSNNRQQKAQKQANRIQQEASERAYQQEISDMRRQNQNSVDTTNLLEQNTGSDVGSTMLTGASGIDPSQLTLGKGNKLLGG